nr:unnamed protein product [Callosobruchus analis]
MKSYLTAIIMFSEKIGIMLFLKNLAAGVFCLLFAIT